MRKNTDTQVFSFKFFSKTAVRSIFVNKIKKPDLDNVKKKFLFLYSFLNLLFYYLIYHGPSSRVG